jgi:hypothetical protein
MEIEQQPTPEEQQPQRRTPRSRQQPTNLEAFQLDMNLSQSNKKGQKGKSQEHHNDEKVKGESTKNRQ